MKVAVTSPSFSENEILQQEMRKYFPGAKLNLDKIRFKKNELISYIKEADGVIIGLETVDAEVLKNCPNLKIISKYGVGLNNIDLDECRKRGIKIGWTGGVNKLSVAEMTVGCMLMLCRNLYVTSNQLKSGIWNKAGGHQLSGKTIGVIGVGNIGKEVIRLLKPFNCVILVNDIIDQSEYYKSYNVIESTKEEIYREADFITLHLPLDESTENLINMNIFNKVKSSVFLLNNSRGGIINENDLKFAIKHNLIAGAAIDVYLDEPPDDRELLELPNLICTPHIGGNAKEAVIAMGMSAINHLKIYINNFEYDE